MSNLNQVFLSGRMGQDPEARTTAGGMPMARFSLATDRPRRNDGERITDWHRVICFDRSAQLVLENGGKGAVVALVGSVHYRKWMDAQGNPHWMTEILANSVTVMPGRKQEADAEPALVDGGDEVELVASRGRGPKKATLPTDAEIPF